MATTLTWQVSCSEEPFQDLSLSLLPAPASGRSAPQANDEPQLGAAAAKRRQDVLSQLPSPYQTAASKTDVHSCLQAHMAPEDMCGDNLYRCDVCDKNQPALRYYQLSKPPQTLILHLKRFEMNAGTPLRWDGSGGWAHPLKPNRTPDQPHPDPNQPHCRPQTRRGSWAPTRPLSPSST